MSSLTSVIADGSRTQPPRQAAKTRKWRIESIRVIPEVSQSTHCPSLRIRSRKGSAIVIIVSGRSYSIWIRKGKTWDTSATSHWTTKELWPRTRLDTTSYSRQTLNWVVVARSAGTSLVATSNITTGGLQTRGREPHGTLDLTLIKYWKIVSWFPRASFFWKQFDWSVFVFC